MAGTAERRKEAVFYLSNRRCVGEGRLPFYLERAKSITGTGSDIRSFGQSADHPEGGEARRIFSLGVGGSLKGGGKSLNDSILERLKTLIAACPHLEKAKVYTDFVREDEICCGIFPVGEKRLSTDWAGNERWQYDFTIQMVGFAFQERERMENAATAERFSRWDERKRREKMDSGRAGADGKPLDRAGTSALSGNRMDRPLYMRWRDGSSTGAKRTDAVPQRHWFFAFESIEERSWLECAEGIVKIEEKGMENTWFFDLSGRKRGTETAAGEIVFTGWLCPQDPFQNRALRQDAHNRRYSGFAAAKRAKRQMPEPREAFAIYRCRGFLRQKMIPRDRIRMQPLTREKDPFIRTRRGNRGFLPEKPGSQEDLFGSR